MRAMLQDESHHAAPSTNLLLAFSCTNVTAVITDPEDPKFDLEKVIASWEKSA